MGSRSPDPPTATVAASDALVGKKLISRTGKIIYAIAPAICDDVRACVSLRGVPNDVTWTDDRQTRHAKIGDDGIRSDGASSALAASPSGQDSKALVII